MNARFKFRVWSSDQKKMYYWSDCVRITNFIYGMFVDHRILGRGSWGIEQCTGLKDKNGKLIYEGDVVVKKDVCALGYRTRTCRVFWHEKWLGWAIETEYGDVYLLEEHEPEQYAVIGNIHEDPDLVEG